MAKVMADTSFVGGPDVARFETAWASYCNAAHAVGVASGTDALELALRAIGVGPGDEVIVPTNSFIASAGAVARIGAIPALRRLRPDHLLIDPEGIAAAVSPRTRAIMPVHLYGQLAPMEGVARSQPERGLQIIEDGAQAHGATRHDRPMGSWGAATATSFYPGKNLGAYGDGGAVTTDSERDRRVAVEPAQPRKPDPLRAPGDRASTPGSTRCRPWCLRSSSPAGPLERGPPWRRDRYREVPRRRGGCPSPLRR